MSENILEVHGLTKEFAGVRALDNIEFSVEKGEIHALMGENGAGKSTLIKILTGLYKADAGQIIFDHLPGAEHDSLSDSQRKHFPGTLSL